ncbi:hypothetical protein CAPN001_07540 [Capnocytophaga stomatis]|uniref:tRNA (Guanine-N1)-methyltransferase n=1 Tax=Capnocytophaga stomatis TaxID=1848904 RepID=A0A250FWE4_9FLAO|nr:hypothetical protein [Capnocytophaga stomatis]ATA88408.1 hypothetical protein CGC58_00855 [Capnocytophaga stomatis]GIJ93107.1 hypothetical protein CAPN002_03250 [Capnocytophaga stomatis]GIJ96185.1 hypothetical protein CAPN001_07540 [Capnocytophaga stomatis]GIM50456.1 hypothetical protein CAPN003_19080 [Capnocytophaga stomatis]
MKKQLVAGAIAVFFSFTFAVNAQEQSLDTVNVQVKKKQNTLNEQFETLVEKANSWQSYKIIDRAKLGNYQKNVIDSLQSIKSKIQAQQDIINGHEEEVKQLNGKIAELQNNLERTQNEKDSVNFLGILLPKSTYSLMVWSLVLILTCLLLFYVYKYINGSAVTKKSLQDLQELQEEYENYRKSAIEREQKVRRQLQDEINKHK